MRLEYINRVKENEVLGKNIYTNDGLVLLRAGVKLKTQYIKKLHELGVYYIYVEDERLEDIDVVDDKLNLLKQETMKSLSSIMKNTGMLDKNNTKQCLAMLDELIDYVLELGDVNKSLYDIKTHDNYTFLHCIDTALMCTFLGLSCNMTKESIREVTIGGLLHDLGKIKVSSTIINKNGPLTDEEFEEMKKHPIYGKELLEENINIPHSSIVGIEQHHEKVNGKGYPYGLTGNEISKYGKIICICDVYDAVSSDRSYRNKFNPSDAYELILAGCGSSFDSSIVKSFKETFSVYPLGCCVRLSNGIEGYVIKQNKNFPDRPVLRILYDNETKIPIKFYEIDLLETPNLIIERVI
ncbi:HD-GYP domain-containing protein (c-di-GMP phosphodiesterase class II) [Clostridium punense]|uniref:HD-GYP domain-containing protein (C-di-GMP phosphodiesterase class II) n=1 Tax=Clostridium punense TaxID=1054297 RepID=A0ABS4K8L4_9CLOT|nr:HD-GYP domain-containing protein [Clostridium punense]MBP2024123.1 HD-GYP domain-containing protein (c-di-GMP phosphodiesterase class II) [Clostridium punense]